MWLTHRSRACLLCVPSLQGGYTTPEQVSRSWLLSMTEWATQPLAGWQGSRGMLPCWV